MLSGEIYNKTISNKTLQKKSKPNGSNHLTIEKLIKLYQHFITIFVLLYLLNIDIFLDPVIS